jgi:hypothetical protein
VVGFNELQPITEGVEGVEASQAWNLSRIVPTHLTSGGGQGGSNRVYVDDESGVRKCDRTKVLLDTHMQLFAFEAIDAGDSKPASAAVRQ